jgi:hypothetical protein
MAREGFQRDDISDTQKITYALKIAESKNCGAAEIRTMLTSLASATDATPGGPYRSEHMKLIPPEVQDRLCRLFLEKCIAAAENIESMLREERDPENRRMLSEGIAKSRSEKGVYAYDILKSGLITSDEARRSLARVFCLAGIEVLRGLALNKHARTIRDAIISEYGSPNVGRQISNGLSAYEAGFILKSVSESLCGSDVSLP